ncbi:MAG: MarR family transcriptional regulator [Ferrovibrio sp.]
MTAREARRIATVRQFNRFYTQCIGVLDESLPQGRLTLTEIRVLFELSGETPATATVLNRRLGLDPGYLSRILHRFERNGLLQREIGRQDRRELHLRLTSAGHAVIAPLDQAASEEVARWLQPLGEEKQQELLAAMQAIMHLLGENAG